LRALLAFVLAEHSTRSLGARALRIGLAESSEAAWRARLRTRAAWLGWLLSALLAGSPAGPPPTRRRVRLYRCHPPGSGWARRRCLARSPGLRPLRGSSGAGARHRPPRQRASCTLRRGRR
jgi:hypothetical protein